MYLINVATKSGTQVNNTHWNDSLCQIGKDKNSDIVLQGFRVGKNHALILQQDGDVFIKPGRDAKEIIVNGNKHTDYGPLTATDRIQIGDYVIQITPGRNNRASQPAAVSPAVRRHSEKSPSPRVQETTAHVNPLDTTPVPAPPVQPQKAAVIPESESGADTRLATEWRLKIHKGVIQVLDLRRVKVNQMDESELRETTDALIQDVMANMPDIPKSLNLIELKRQVLAEAVGLGPLEDLIADESISEIMVNAKDQIFFEKSGRLLKSSVTFSDDNAVLSAIERIVSPLGRRIDESSPMVDARLKDGSRVNAIIPPLALKGPCITIRKFMKERLEAQDLVRFGSISPTMVEFLQTAVHRKKNTLISGGTGSGKTTLLNVLSNFIPMDERIVTVEDAAELRLSQTNLVALEARPSNQEGKGQVTIRDLVKNCLRMRPDRIVVGECRGGEALDMLQAMNTGHDGSLTTIHANNPRDCLSRLEILVLMSGMDLPVRAIREQISSAVDIVVQQTRFSCGTRKVTSITEITGVEGDTIQTSEIFKYTQTGYDDQGKITGYFHPTGIIPEFYEDLRRRGVEVDLSIFEVTQ